jgi:hypothetical protein
VFVAFAAEEASETASESSEVAYDEFEYGLLLLILMMMDP